MKMPQDMFETLKHDFFKVAHAIAESKGPFDLNRARWSILSRVEQERQYTGDLRSQLETMTGIPCSVAAIEGYRMGPWYDVGLNDAHIETALRRALAS